MLNNSNVVVDYNTLHKLMGSVGDRFLMTDVAGKIVFMNKAAEDLLE